MRVSELPTKYKIAIAAGALLVVFIILDFGYFLANIKFIFFRPPPPQVQTALQSPAVTKIQPNLLIIDSLGIQAPVVYAADNSETAYQAALINGVTHFPGTANPGQLGNCYIFGHSSDFIWSKGHYKTVFAVLPKIKLGADIVISGQDGSKFVYIVTASHEVAANDLSVLNQQGYQKKLLTLQTSYPVGTALARWVVVAEEKAM